MMLEKKIVLVTGGSSGIGAEIARQFRVLGNDVIICGRNEEKLKVTAAILRHGNGRKVSTPDLLWVMAAPEQTADFEDTARPTE